MAEEAEKVDEKTTVAYWKKEPHNCTDREAQTQVDKYKDAQAAA